MDFNGWVLASVSFAGGWIAHSSFSISPPLESKQTSCLCDCHCNGPAINPSPQTVGYPLVLSVVIGLIILGLLISNFALVCQVSFRDGSTGLEREIHLNVKGKSEGVFGASRGLAITN